LELQIDVAAYFSIIVVGGCCSLVYDLVYQTVQALLEANPLIYCGNDPDDDLKAIIKPSSNSNVIDANGSTVSTQSNKATSAFNYGNKGMTSVQLLAHKKAELAATKVLITSKETIVIRPTGEMEKLNLTPLQVRKLGTPVGDTVQDLARTQSGVHLNKFTGLVETGHYSDAVSYMFNKTIALRQEGETAPDSSRSNA
jgi:hypothetical protein